MLIVSRTPSPAAFRARLRLLMVLTIVTVALAVLQRTAIAPLPASADGFVAGLAMAFVSGALVGWQVSRD